MTVCKKLAEKTLPNGNKVSAWENWNKFAAAPYYEVVIERKDSALIESRDVFKCARTTWRKKYEEVCKNA